MSGVDGHHEVALFEYESATVTNDDGDLVREPRVTVMQGSDDPDIGAWKPYANVVVNGRNYIAARRWIRHPKER